MKIETIELSDNNIDSELIHSNDKETLLRVVVEDKIVAFINNGEIFIRDEPLYVK